ncbi:hypothetical protein BC937DRAFT_93364 [Endogone sp. FLAS-F59071]|nr:hypothetical protein BC937DRAFT_93364 [Endogone sp. FLAS-F59071]|eukprot:RUS21203.1 hypothetical protein BC937DRAFT_93364 [Endogone sp. FLAS-F59071]
MADNSPANSTSPSSSPPSSPLSLPPSSLKKKKKKGKNFSILENKQLYHSWLNILQDPVASTGQKATTFWQKIYHYYNEFNKIETKYIEDSLSNHWLFILKMISKFCSAIAQIKSYEKSGEIILNKKEDKVEFICEKKEKEE